MDYFSRLINSFAFSYLINPRQANGQEGCPRCPGGEADFLGSTTPTFLTVSCEETFPIANFEEAANISAACGPLQMTVELAGCCTTSDTSGGGFEFPEFPSGTNNDNTDNDVDNPDSNAEDVTGSNGDEDEPDTTAGGVCARCPGGEGDFKGTYANPFLDGTCEDEFPLTDFEDVGSVCGLLQSSVESVGCCATSDDGCWNEMVASAECIEDNPNCEDECGGDIDDDQELGDECPERSQVEEYRRCCPACSSQIDAVFRCLCDNGNVGGGGGGNSGAFSTSHLLFSLTVSFVVTVAFIIAPADI